MEKQAVKRLSTILWLFSIALPMVAIQTCTGTGALAQGFLNQDWILDPKLSHVYMQSVKANAVFETHQFTSVEGNVGRNGHASIKIDLASLETGIDVRDVRMRFLMFETFKFPYATITANLDKPRLQALATETRIAYPMIFTLDMRGFQNQIKADVWVTRVSESTISVATIKPIIVTTDSVGLTANLAKLMDVIGGTQIASGASITFDLVFGTGSVSTKLASARALRERVRAEASTSAISAEECETRFSVISKTGAIYFKSGSAELDDASDPLLESLADITKRCGTVKLDVEGHTDSVGGKTANQRLSEQRAKAVVGYLTSKGVGASRIQSAGYGDTRPVSGNETETSRAANRRIEFRVRKE